MCEVSITLAEVSRALLELGYPADQTLSKLTWFWTLPTPIPQQWAQLEKITEAKCWKESHWVALNEAESETKYWTSLESIVKLQAGQVPWLNEKQWNTEILSKYFLSTSICKISEYNKMIPFYPHNCDVLPLEVKNHFSQETTTQIWSKGHIKCKFH